ncbi:ATP-binding protein, partial [Candidatus Chloroploca sp. M-50]
GVAGGVAGVVAGVVAGGVAAVSTSLHLWSYPFGLLGVLRVAFGKPTPARARWLPPLWDERAVLPFPWLSRALVNLARHYPQEGREVLAQVAAHPYQRRAALQAYVRLTVNEAGQAQSLPTIANLNNSLTWLPADDDLLPQLRSLLPTLRDISKEVAAALEPGSSVDNQINRLHDARQYIDETRQGGFWSATPDLAPLQATLGAWDRIIADRINQIERELQARGYIRNPYKPSGNPLEPDRSGDHEVFRGRDATFERLSRLVGDNSRPTPLLLVGPRRSGKSSILRFLPKRMSSKILPVDLSMQAQVDSLPALLERLEQDIRERALRASNRRSDMPRLDRNRAEREPLAAFWSWIDQVEQWLGEQVLLLALDEYEGLERGITRGTYDERVLEILRSLIQDRRKIAVMLAGVHELDEMRPVWASHLINVVSIRVGFLEQADARGLLRQPTPAFPTATLAPVEDEILRLTHCQPFLLQVLAYSLIERLNAQGRYTATPADLTAILPQLFAEQTGAYLSDQWRTESGGDIGEAVLTRLAQRPHSGDELRTLVGSDDSFGRLLRRMTRREIITRTEDGHYQITVPLLQHYIQQETRL